MPRPEAHARSKAAPTSSRLVRLDHQVVQLLGQLERRLGQRQGVVPGVAVVEAHLELDARRRSPSPASPTAPSRARRWRSACGLVEGGRGEHGVAEADAVGEEAAGHQRRRVRRPAASSRPATSSTRTPHGAIVRASRRTRRAARSSSAALRARGSRRLRAARDGRRTRRRRRLRSRRTRASLAGPGSTMTRCALSSLRHVSAPAGRLTGDETDDVGEERRQRRRVGHLDAQVGELELMSHRGSFRSASEDERDHGVGVGFDDVGRMRGRCRRGAGTRAASTNMVGAAPVTM